MVGKISRICFRLFLILSFIFIPGKTASSNPSHTDLEGMANPFPSALAQTSSLVINEVMFRPEEGSSEWVEIKNSGSEISIAGYALTDEDGNWITISEALPPIPANGFVVIFLDGLGSAADDYDFSDNVATIHSSSGFVNLLEDEADQVALYSDIPFFTYLPLISQNSTSAPSSFPAEDQQAEYQAVQRSTLGANLLSFVAWGGNPAEDAGRAVTMGIWSEGTYKETHGIGEPPPMIVEPEGTVGLLPGAQSPMVDFYAIYSKNQSTPGAENPIPQPIPYTYAGDVLHTETFAVSWEYVEQATAYQFQLDDDPLFGSPYADLTTEGTAYIPSSTVPVGQYYWRVRAILSEGNGPWSSVYPVESANLLQSGNQSQSTAMGNPLNVAWKVQRKDTEMLCLGGDHETAAVEGVIISKQLNAPWNKPHPDNAGTIKEHGQNYCARAAVSMAASYYNKTLSQDRIAFYEACESRDSSCREGILNQLGHGQINQFVGMSGLLSWANIDADPVRSYKPTWQAVKGWIDQNRPIILLGNNHFRVLTGYADSNSQSVYIHDSLRRGNELLPWANQTVIMFWVLPASDLDVRADEPELKRDSDNDGIVDFDEVQRFGTLPNNPDTDGDGIPDKADLREAVFNNAGKYSLIKVDLVSDNVQNQRKMNWDGDTKIRKELDPDNDNDQVKDGCEDTNLNGIFEKNFLETSNFDTSQAKSCDPNWPMYGHDPARTSWNNVERELRPPLRISWSRSIPNYYSDSMSVANGMIYLGGMEKPSSNRVYAYSTLGVQKWQFTLNGGGGGAMDSTPAYYKNKVFFGGQSDNKFYAANSQNGAIQWTLSGVGGMYGSPANVFDDIAYAYGYSNLYAVNVDTGRVLWSSPAKGWVGRTAVWKDTIVASSWYASPAAFDRKTGRILWTRSDISTYFSDVVIFEKIAYLGDRYANIIALDLEDGHTLWTTHLPNNPTLNGVTDFSLATSNDTLFVAGGVRSTGQNPQKQNILLAINLKNGQIIWKTNVAASWRTLVVANNTLYTLKIPNYGNKEQLIALNPKTGSQLWSWSPTESTATYIRSIVVSDRFLYVTYPIASGTSLLKCFTNSP